MDKYKKKVFCTAICDSCWMDPPQSLPALRNTLDILITDTYQGIPDEYISLLLLQLFLQEQKETICSEMSGAELSGRKKARRLIAAEVLGLSRKHSDRDMYHINSLVGEGLPYEGFERVA